MKGENKMAGMERTDLTIYQASKMIDVSCETIINWIVKGKLKAEGSPYKKEGCVIKSTDFIEAVSKNPRYKGKLNPEAAGLECYRNRYF